MRRVEQAEGPDPVQSLEGDVLEEAAQELVRRKGHELAPLIPSVPVAEGHWAQLHQAAAGRAEVTDIALEARRS